ncbi:hypothetical protein [Candidatus Coxiella mudrowiae]|nr:hypothetical protein [Candidatus Coxiella mudrowiae]
MVFPEGVRILTARLNLSYYGYGAGLNLASYPSSKGTINLFAPVGDAP